MRISCCFCCSSSHGSREQTQEQTQKRELFSLVAVLLASLVRRLCCLKQFASHAYPDAYTEKRKRERGQAVRKARKRLAALCV